MTFVRCSYRLSTDFFRSLNCSSTALDCSLADIGELISCLALSVNHILLDPQSGKMGISQEVDGSNPVVLGNINLTKTGGPAKKEEYSRR